MAFNQGCKAVVPKGGQCARFLQYGLIATTETMKAAGSGSTFLELSAEGLAAMEIPEVVPEEQRRIADFLDDRVSRLDQIVAARRSQLELVHEASFSALGDALRDSGPPRRLAWSLRLAAVGVVVNPSSYFREAGVPFVHGYNVREGWFDLTDLKKMSEADSLTLDRSRLRANDVLVVRAGFPGRAAVVPPDLEGGNCASVLLLRPGAALSPHWLAAFFNSPLGKAQIESVQYGAAQGVINLSDVVSFAVPLPPVAEQERRLSRLREQEAELGSGRRLIERQVDELGTYKESLITAAVTGEIDVTTAGSRIPG